MNESKRTFGIDVAVSAIAGASAALVEVLRAIADPAPLSPAYAAWCVLLVIAASTLVGILCGLVARLRPALLFVPWLFAAGTLVHGPLGGLAFSVSGFAVCAFARKSPPSLLPWGVSLGALFEHSGSHANRLHGLVEAHLLTSEQSALAQHVLAFAAAGVALAWLLGRERIRPRVAASTLALLACSALFSIRDGFERASPPPSPAGSTASLASDSEGPSVLLVVLDTLRADHTSLYGYGRKTTPELERVLAAHPGARRFSAAYANGSWTVPAHASLLCGQLPSVHGADFAGRKSGEPLAVGIAAEVPMLAELLVKQGWKTFGVFANRWLRNAQGFRRGFEDFEHVEPRTEIGPLGERLREILVPGLRGGEVTSYPTAELVNERLLARLDALGAARFFGLVNYMDAHGPHMPRPEVAGTFGPWSVFDDETELDIANSPQTIQRLINRYDEQILQLDRELGRVFDELERRRIFERTWVFVVADHGEAFAEHGVIDHGSGVFDEIVRVPLIVFPPPGAELAPDNRPVSQVDVAATIAAIAGAEYQGPGRDLRATHTDARVLIQHGAEPFRSARCGHLTGVDARAVISGKWKLLDTDGRVRLFDLEADPGETLDRAKDMPDLVERLRAELPERMLRATPVGPGTAPDLDEARRLRALGY